MLEKNGSSYDPDKYYMEAGTSFRKQVKVNQSRNDKDALSIIRAHNPNYRTEADQIRNYQHHGMMQDVIKIEADGHIEAAKEIIRLLEEDRMVEEQEQIRERRTRQITYFEMVEENISILLDDEDMDGINSLLHTIEDMSYDEALPPGVRRKYSRLYDEVVERMKKYDSK